MFFSSMSLVLYSGGYQEEFNLNVKCLFLYKAYLPLCKALDCRG